MVVFPHTSAKYGRSFAVPHEDNPNYHAGDGNIEMYFSFSRKFIYKSYFCLISSPLNRHLLKLEFD